MTYKCDVNNFETVPQIFKYPQCEIMRSLKYPGTNNCKKDKFVTQ